MVLAKNNLWNRYDPTTQYKGEFMMKTKLMKILSICLILCMMAGVTTALAVDAPTMVVSSQKFDFDGFTFGKVWYYEAP